MKCQVLVFNSKTKESEWINGIITGTTTGDVGEEFERINVLANGISYFGCHPDCVKQQIIILVMPKTLQTI